MGSQSCVVVVGFICLHVAFILNVIALSTPYWIAGGAVNATTDPANVTNEVDKGLWKICRNGDCDSLTSTHQPVWFRAVQATFTIGVGLCLVTLIIYYYFFMMAIRYVITYRLNCLMAIITTLDCVCILVAVVLFGKQYQSEDDVYPPEELGWSYYVAISGTVFTFLSSLLIYREGWLLRSETRPYEDL